MKLCLFTKPMANGQVHAGTVRVSLSPLSQMQSLLAQELTVMSPHPGDKETQQPD